GKSIQSYAFRVSAGDEAAGKALKEIGARAIPVLVELLQSRSSPTDQRIWQTVKKMPRRLRPKKWDIPLPPTDSALRSAGARSLAVLGPEAAPAIPQLLAALHDQDFQVRNDVTLALEKIGPATSPGLVKTLDTEDPDVRLRAVTLLGKLGPEAQAALPAV